MQASSSVLSNGVRMVTVLQHGDAPAIPRMATKRNISIAAMAGGSITFLLFLHTVLKEQDPVRRLVAWKDLVREVTAAAVTPGMATYVVKAIPTALEKMWTLVKGTVCEGMADALKRSMLRVGSTVAMAAFVDALRLCWDTAWFLTAKYSGDQLAAQLHLNRMKAICSVVRIIKDVFVLIAAPVVIAGSGLAIGSLGTAFISILAGSVFHVASKGRIRCGGWFPYLKSWFSVEGRMSQWDSPLWEATEEHISDELRCSITHAIVVDPLRSTFNGRIYEKAAILRWVNERGRDPLTNQLAVASDYIAAPVAAEASQRYATLLGAQAFFIEQDGH